jgi:hypothetical protein
MVNGGLTFRHESAQNRAPAALDSVHYCAWVGQQVAALTALLGLLSASLTPYGGGHGQSAAGGFSGTRRPVSTP